MDEEKYWEIGTPPKYGKTLDHRRFESYAVHQQCSSCGEFAEIVKSIGPSIHLCGSCLNTFTWNQLRAAEILLDPDMAKAVLNWEKFFHE